MLIELPKTVANVADNGGTIDEAFEAYSKTGGARNKIRWSGKCTLTKFKREFGPAFKKHSKSAPQGVPQAAPDVAAVVAAVLTALGQNVQPETDADEPQETDAEAAKRRLVRPENRNLAPTSGMTYLLIMAGQEAGISTAVKIPVFRGACSELIGKVKEAQGKNDVAKVRRLLGA
jgi:hypothetical protein